VLGGTGFTLPVFIWSLFIGIVIANLCELTGFYRLSPDAIDTLGTISLSLFLAMALMSLRLWELVSLAGPMLAILLGQTTVMALFAYLVTFRVMGGNYDAAIMSGGHCGFGMGATPTAVANMEALVSRYGPSPQSFLVVPMVGAFFIDITNAMVIQAYLALPVFGF
jgi:ESS family glutamate:Na+ symporter